MDLNYLFYRQQMSLLRAGVASCPESRAAHEGLARGYREKILAYRDHNRKMMLAARPEHEVA